MARGEEQMLIIVFLVCCVFSIISVITSSSDEEPEPKPDPAPDPAPEEKPEMSFSTSAALTAEREFIVPQVRAGRIPVDCVLTDWQNVDGDTCNSTGQQKQKKDIITEAKDGGKECPDAESDERKRTINCDVDCVQTETRSGCNKSTGKITITRTTTQRSWNNGAACKPATATENCAVNCEGSWSGWGACSATCGGGTQSQSWSTTVSPKNGGSACPSPSTQTQGCNTQGCYSIRTAYTGRTAASDGSGSDRLKELGYLDCGDDAINGFKLERDGNEIFYSYTCLEGVNSSSSPGLVTSQEEHGGHNKVYLDRLQPNCGSKPISKFKYMYGTQNFNKDEGWYSGYCSDLSHTGNCRDVYTDWNDEEGHKVVYLDRHHLQCESNEAMTDFKYERDNKGKMRYKYKCCDMPSPR